MSIYTYMKVETMPASILDDWITMQFTVQPQTFLLVASSGHTQQICKQLLLSSENIRKHQWGKNGLGQINACKSKVYLVFNLLKLMQVMLEARAAWRTKENNNYLAL